MKWIGPATSVAAIALMSLPAAAEVSPDPFASLMPLNGTAALAWSRQQTEATTREIEASSTFKTVVAAIQQVHAESTALPSYYRVGARYLRLTKNTAHPYGLLEYADAKTDDSPGPWKMAFDLDAYNKTVQQPYSIKWLDPINECRPPAYDRCMLPLWPNGEQHNEYREIDLKTGRFVDKGFVIGPSRTGVAWLDGDTLLVAHSTQGAPALPSQFPAELHLWKRGTALAAAPTIFRAAPTDALFSHTVVTAGGRRRIIVTLASTYTSFQLKEISPDGMATDLPLPRALNNFGTPIATGGRIVLQLAAPALVDGRTYPADTIISFDLVQRKTVIVTVPPSDIFLSGAMAGTEDGLLFVGTHALRHILFFATPDGDGWKVAQKMVQQPGMTLELRGAGEANRAALLLEQGLTVPPRVSISSGEADPIAIDMQKPYMDLSDYVVEIRSAKSNDGVPVDYYFMHRKGAHAGPTPTILQGYGGFGVSNDPQYFGYRLGAGLKAWFDRGGAFAAAAVRGGGERGGAWHLAGVGAHKKQMFDDFIAVAEDLERSEFTDPAHLGITGHSNGGVLVSGAEVLRPDLFGAVLDGAPITDFFAVGHGDGGIGAGLKAEFGDVGDPKQVPTILQWAPYQNIKAGVRYPPTLAFVASNDTQVGPGHARKFTARLQQVGTPAMLLEGTEGGHDYPSEYTQLPDAAMLTTFMIDALMKR